MGLQPYQHLDRKRVEFGPGITAEFVYIDAPGVAPDGFMMGSPGTEEGRHGDEDQFRAVLTKGYWLQTTPVTQEQWQAVMGANPSHFHGRDGRSGGPQHPVEVVSWNDCQMLIERLRARGIAARLPTEAEWEFACRAGSTTAYSFGNDAAQLGMYAWFADNSGQARIDSSAIWSNDRERYGERILANNCRTHPVGTKRANAWGLFDMHGNVWEFCQDWYGDYPSGRTENPLGAAAGELRVLRGGSWVINPQDLRSAYRRGLTPSGRNIRGGGVRLALDSE